MGTFQSIEAMICAASALLGHGLSVEDAQSMLVSERGVSTDMAFLAVTAASLL